MNSLLKGFEPSLLDKLLDDSPKRSDSSSVFKSVSLEQHKESVARDLEGLLNSRAAFSEDELERYPNCRKSLVTYGLCDFSGLSLANAYDRAKICRSLEQAIARHESRLVNVKVSINASGRSASALHFTISALLNIRPAREPVSFDALFQTNTQQYSVSRLRRAASSGSGN
ncbi:MAG: type VI secretion system baseplate subunit TssE [Xanthomonadaceae bacterium]|nr:type VI secretion system baseplate subunit TssE [Xanthomonadaceae bacterium]